MNIIDKPVKIYKIFEIWQINIRSEIIIPYISL